MPVRASLCLGSPRCRCCLRRRRRRLSFMRPSVSARYILTVGQMPSLSVGAISDSPANLTRRKSNYPPPALANSIWRSDTNNTYRVRCRAFARPINNTAQWTRSVCVAARTKILEWKEDSVTEISLVDASARCNNNILRRSTQGLLESERADARPSGAFFHSGVIVDAQKMKPSVNCIWLASEMASRP